MEREKPREPPQAGDIRLDPFEVLRSEQPLAVRKRRFCAEATICLSFTGGTCWRNTGKCAGHVPCAQKKQQDRSRTSPASNTLGSCIDNAVADQIDNRPEALMIPEREETAQSAGRNDRRGELRALSGEIRRDIRHADGRAAVTGTRRGAGFLGRRSGRRRGHGQRDGLASRRIFIPTRCTKTFSLGAAVLRRHARAWHGWSSTIPTRAALCSRIRRRGRRKRTTPCWRRRKGTR